MFTVNYDTGAVVMHRGDTGAYIVSATRKTGEPWGADDRMLLTVWNGAEALLQRIYRLDDDELGNGVVLIEFHNEDTDKLPIGSYPMERRYIISPTWDVAEGEEIPTERCADALQIASKIVDGAVVRVPPKGQTTITLQDIYGEV